MLRRALGPRYSLMDQLPVAKSEPKSDPHRRFALMVGDTKFHLSEKERVICETWLRTNGNLSECARIANARFHRTHSPATIRAWVNRRKLISRYLEEEMDKRAEVASYSEEDWKLLGIQVLKGKKRIDRVQAQVWRDLGNVILEKKDGPSLQTNIQINFREAE